MPPSGESEAEAAAAELIGKMEFGSKDTADTNQGKALDQCASCGKWTLHYTTVFSDGLPRCFLCCISRPVSLLGMQEDLKVEKQDQSVASETKAKPSGNAEKVRMPPSGEPEAEAAAELLGKMSFGPKDTTHQCASCGKWSDALKKCTACKRTWYCNVSCQKAHRKDHKEKCKLVEKMEKMRQNLKVENPDQSEASEISEELGMFESPPKEDCVICMLPLPLESMMASYQACCGKRLCGGCVIEHARVINATNEERETNEDLAHLPLLDETCAFCREPIPDPPPSLENLRRLQKRVELGDAEATKQLGLHYTVGGYGLPVDKRKALELFHRSADLGDARACNELCKAYLDSDYLGVSLNPAMAFKYQVLAAKRGHAIARHSLGRLEMGKGNMDLAVRHWRISAAAGLKESASKLIKCFQHGHISKGDLEESIRAQHNAREEARSDERDRFIDYLKETGQYWKYEPLM